MKLALSRPCCNRSAIHSASLTSVFLPGTALICCALTTSTSKLLSSRLNTGFQYTPVASKATCVQPCSLEPITELQQLLGGGKVGTKFFLKLTIGRVCQHTDLHGLLMHIQSSAVGVENFHSTAPVLFFLLSKGCSGLDGLKRRFSSACCWRNFTRQRNKGWFLRPPRSVSWSGSETQYARDLCCRSIFSYSTLFPWGWCSPT